MVDATRYLRWKDALDINNKNLEEVLRQLKLVTSEYQKYLDENPHKAERRELMERKERLINRIILLTKQGVNNYDGK